MELPKELLGDVHVNFSLNKELLKALYEQFYKDKYHSLVDFQNHLYLSMAQCFVPLSMAIHLTFTVQARFRKM